MVHPSDWADLSEPRGDRASYHSPGSWWRARRDEGQDLTPPQWAPEREGNISAHSSKCTVKYLKVFYVKTWGWDFLICDFRELTRVQKSSTDSGRSCLNKSLCSCWRLPACHSESITRMGRWRQRSAFFLCFFTVLSMQTNSSPHFILVFFWIHLLLSWESFKQMPLVFPVVTGSSDWSLIKYKFVFVFLVFRVTVSWFPLTMSAQSGGRQWRSSRRNVSVLETSLRECLSLVIVENFRTVKGFCLFYRCKNFLVDFCGASNVD